MKKPYYGTYIHKFGTGFVGVRFGKEISTWEPINDKLHEDFINNYSFMNIYGTLQTIKDKIYEHIKDKMAKVKVHELYLDLLLKYRMSNMSVYVNDWLHNGPFISRLDCLNEEQFYYLMNVLEIEYKSNIKVWDCKLGDLDKFVWKGV